MELFVLILPLVTALLFWTTNRQKTLHVINCLSASVLLLLAAFITGKVLQTGSVSHPLWNRFFYLDAFSVLMLDIILTISFMVGFYNIGYLNEEYRQKVIDLRGMKLFYSLTYAFIFTVILVVTTQNLGVMWIAIEATTLASALLVGLYNNREAVEAAWKYVIICSVGIALALLGIVFLYISAVHLFADPALGLNWLELLREAPLLHGSILKIAFIFILLGFGTKAGLVPVHTWLPDAYSLAPSPISALLSGILSTSAIYVIIRVQAIVNRALGSSIFTGRLLVTAGLLSIGVAAVFMLTQKEYKRLLAYSSIEHIGIVVFGLGIFTPLALFGALFQLMNHALVKTLLFLSAGSVNLKYKSREISKVTGLIRTMPRTGISFLLGLFAVAGLPPFAVFASELTLAAAGFQSGHVFPTILFVLFLALVFVGIATSGLPMFFGPRRGLSGETENRPGEPNPPGTGVVITLLIILLVAGIYLPKPILSLLQKATIIIGGK